MKRSTVSFVCQECGYESPKYMGKCPECGTWNSLREFQISNSKNQISKIGIGDVDIKPKTLEEVQYAETQRLSSGFLEFDNVLGGGIVKGSVTLLAGDPGIGKSTLLLQLALNLAHRSYKSNKSYVSNVLYISGEESEEQVKLRATRLNSYAKSNNSTQHFLLLSTSDIDAIITTIQEIKPSLVIIDSIQTMESAQAGGLSGSVSQVRYAAALFIRAAKTLGIPFIIVGHVTKEGMVAGPMTLSHMVDTVLFLEGEKFTTTRILRSFKNRFGPVDEVGVFLMGEKGMEEVKNPEQIFLSEKMSNAPGSVLVATLEGTRAFLVEIQALAVFSKLPFPRRVVSGIDTRRVELLLAVMQKHAKLPVETMDVFVNVAGGLKVSDPAADLGVCLALFSSLKNVALKKTVAVSEVGLLGELRPVTYLDKRVKEAKKMGFSTIISSKTHKSLGEVIKTLSS